jgi:hypothetical protein
MVKDFEVIGEIIDVETIAAGRSIYVLKRLKRFYGAGRWRKLKGVAKVKLPDGAICRAELHWYESGGIGRKEVKIKRILS